MLAAWGLTSDVTASMEEELAWALFSTGRTLVSTNFATFTVSLAATAKACSTEAAFFLAFASVAGLSLF